MKYFIIFFSFVSILFIHNVKAAELKLWTDSLSNKTYCLKPDEKYLGIPAKRPEICFNREQIVNCTRVVEACLKSSSLPQNERLILKIENLKNYGELSTHEFELIRSNDYIEPYPFMIFRAVYYGKSVTNDDTVVVLWNSNQLFMSKEEKRTIDTQLMVEVSINSKVINSGFFNIMK
jgi:hypothetical protein